ncbi:MAG TPA: serine dehydratase subunit alpha family protein [Tepidanaerobacter syntrophicus]|uniref:L-cysteine desulfidase family protein n=1 Tax=Tepidanaerobacter syntrophicus TaxID=224999 RepID=UPI00176DFA6F|nr:L-serine ammonia-lyase, iron-sulfur-dependent, subunit alpha [Tepidanaerobacter syntrophicus]HHV82273.1 serine dehydratase subunit alpha family protein [Tepidanaerobacter syntrophicus]
MAIMTNSLLFDILKDQVTPALGCTEPIAVALAVAKAKETLGSLPERLEIKVDRNIFKNALAVGIPKTKEKGLYMAAALALVAGKSKYKLEVLKDITEEDILEAGKIVDSNIIHVDIAKEKIGLYVEVTAISGKEESKVIIKDKHDNIVLVEKNGEVIFNQEAKNTDKFSLRESIKGMKIRDLAEFATQVEVSSLELVDEGIKMNKKMAEAGMDSKYGRALSGGTLIDEMNYREYAKYLTAVASYARMSGYPLPVMSCAGSGNHGLTAILPVVAVGEKKGISYDKIVRAVTLSLLVTIYVKSYTGTLSPVCGCGVAAGVGAGAGVTYMLGGNLEQIEGSIKNMIGTMAGIICDGGKPGCAFKLAISVDAALESALMALNGVVISPDDGIVDETAEKTIQNLGKVSTDGMINTDETILEVMLGKCR